MKFTALFLMAFGFATVLKAQTTDTLHSKTANKYTPHYDVPPQFPEGDFDTYILNHLKFAQNLNSDGTSLFSFITKIDSLGNISIEELSFKISPEINQVFIDVINSSPQWKPAMLNGKPVSSFHGSAFLVDFDKSAGTIKARIHHFSKGPHPITENSIFTAVDVPPVYPGGEKAFKKFIDKNVHYPLDATGVAIASFVVEKDGHLSDIKIMRTPSAEIGIEVKRLLSMCPNWIPGKRKGEIVRVAFMEPIRFN